MTTFMSIDIKIAQPAQREKIYAYQLDILTKRTSWLWDMKSEIRLIQPVSIQRQENLGLVRDKS